MTVYVDPREVKKSILKYAQVKCMSITLFCETIWISRPTYYKLVSWTNKRIKNSTIEQLKKHYVLKNSW